MDKKIKELIAIGASISGHCQSCLEYHIKEATDNGASKDEIHMAIAIGKAIDKGASTVMNNFINNNVGDEIKSQDNICCVNSSSCTPSNIE